MSLTLKRKTLAISLLALSYNVSAVQINVLNLSTNALAYDAHTGRLYASIPSVAGPGLGNTITAIDPHSGSLLASTFVGSEPGAIAISDDGKYLYTGLNGAAAIRRVDLASMTAGLQFSLGNDSFSGPYFPEDIEVMPGAPNTVAVSLRNASFSPRHEGVAIFDNGVQRPNKTPDHTGSNRIEFGATPNVLYGYNNESTEFGFRTMQINAQGLQVTSVRALITGFGADIEYADGRIYSTSGRVIDPVSGTLLGTYAANGSTAVDTENGLVHFLSGFGFGFGGSVTLSTFDLNTFVLLNSMTINNVVGSSSDLVSLGEDRLAFRTTGGQIFLIDPTPVPVPAAFWLLTTSCLGILTSSRKQAAVHR